MAELCTRCYNCCAEDGYGSVLVLPTTAAVKQLNSVSGDAADSSKYLLYDQCVTDQWLISTGESVLISLVSLDEDKPLRFTLHLFRASAAEHKDKRHGSF